MRDFHVNNSTIAEE